MTTATNIPTALLSILLLFVAVSCNQKNETDSHVFTATLEPVDTLEISIDNTTRPFHFITDVCEIESKECLYFNESNRIDFYSLDTRKLTKQLKIPVEGPNGVGSLEYMRYVSADTMFVKGKSPFSIYQFNGKGVKTNTYDLTQGQHISKLRGFYANNNSPFLYLNRQLFLYVNPAVTSRGWVFNQPPLFRYTCADSTLSPLPFRFPEVFNDKQAEWTFIDFDPAVVLRNETVVASFPYQDSLYVYQPSHQQVERYSVRSIFQKGDNKPQKKVKSVDADYEIYRNITAYNFMAYDKYRDVFYRFVLHPVDMNIKPNAVIALNAITTKKPLSVQIIDSKFKLIGEVSFFKNKFDPDDFFVGKKGLYVSNNHSDNERFDETKLSYTVFALRRNK